MGADKLEANKTVVRRLYERVLNGRDPAAVDELFAEDSVGLWTGPIGVRDRDALRRSLARLPALFGDARWELDTSSRRGTGSSPAGRGGAPTLPPVLGTNMPSHRASAAVARKVPTPCP